MHADEPTFVRGMSRSGGTLMATVIDAHPDVAMSYELYPQLLELDDGTADRLRELADAFDAGPNLKSTARELQPKNFVHVLHSLRRAAALITATWRGCCASTLRRPIS